MIISWLPCLWRSPLLTTRTLIFLILKSISALCLEVLSISILSLLVLFISASICLVSTIHTHILCSSKIHSECIKENQSQEDLCFLLQEDRKWEFQEIASKYHEVWTQSIDCRSDSPFTLSYQHTSAFQHQTICREEDLKVCWKDSK